MKKYLKVVDDFYLSQPPERTVLNRDCKPFILDMIDSYTDYSNVQNFFERVQYTITDGKYPQLRDYVNYNGFFKTNYRSQSYADAESIRTIVSKLVDPADGITLADGLIQNALSKFIGDNTSSSTNMMKEVSNKSSREINLFLSEIQSYISMYKESPTYSNLKTIFETTLASYYTDCKDTSGILTSLIQGSNSFSVLVMLLESLCIVGRNANDSKVNTIELNSNKNNFKVKSILGDISMIQNTFGVESELISEVSLNSVSIIGDIMLDRKVDAISKAELNIYQFEILMGLIQSILVADYTGREVPLSQVREQLLSSALLSVDQPVDDNTKVAIFSNLLATTTGLEVSDLQRPIQGAPDLLYTAIRLDHLLALDGHLSRLLGKVSNNTLLANFVECIFNRNISIENIFNELNLSGTGLANVTNKDLAFYLNKSGISVGELSQDYSSEQSIDGMMSSFLSLLKNNFAAI